MRRLFFFFLILFIGFLFGYSVHGKSVSAEVVDFSNTQRATSSPSGSGGVWRVTYNSYETYPSCSNPVGSGAFLLPPTSSKTLEIPGQCALFEVCPTSSDGGCLEDPYYSETVELPGNLEVSYNSIHWNPWVNFSLGVYPDQVVLTPGSGSGTTYISLAPSVPIQGICYMAPDAFVFGVSGCNDVDGFYAWEYSDTDIVPGATFLFQLTDYFNCSGYNVGECMSPDSHYYLYRVPMATTSVDLGNFSSGILLYGGIFMFMAVFGFLAFYFKNR